MGDWTTWTTLLKTIFSPLKKSAGNQKNFRAEGEKEAKRQVSRQGLQRGEEMGGRQGKGLRQEEREVREREGRQRGA